MSEPTPVQGGTGEPTPLDTSGVEQARLLRCAMGGDLVMRRCHTDARCANPGGCNVREHYCGCEWQTWERVHDA